jgi:hypothetical protein
MKKDYVKQLEEANQSLRDKLETETLLREIAKRRSERWYDVIVISLTEDNIMESSKAEVRKRLPIPFVALQALSWTYSTPSIVSARAIINSHLYMDGHKKDYGIYWKISLAAKRNPDDAWIPAREKLEGWVVSSLTYPGWGGNYINHYPINPQEVCVTTKYYESYTDYARYVLESERTRQDASQ